MMRVFKHYKHGSKRGGQTYHVKRGLKVRNPWVSPMDEFEKLFDNHDPITYNKCRYCKGYHQINYKCPARILIAGIEAEEEGGGKK